ncbi:MAG: lysophospholipid acyltransferase family protein [Candidatus Cloacimonetes bacterium]|nr:lysophospholipid acyltransferase family protein [Candidatus Cloacimonadota bacterium]
MHKFFFYLERKLAAKFLLLLRKSIRFTVINQEASDNIRCIYMFWHRNLLPLTMQRVFSGAGVLVSSSTDGELIAGPLEELGYIAIRGSSTRQGAKAMLEMIRAAKSISLAITPDGPKGPHGSIHPGIFQIALLAKIPIVAIASHTNREWVFNSWDRFRFPKPFSCVTAVYSDPIYVDCKESFSDAEDALRRFMSIEESKFKAKHKKHK